MNNCTKVRTYVLILHPFQQDLFWVFALKLVRNYLLLQLIKADFPSEECLRRNAVSVWKHLSLRRKTHMFLPLATKISNSIQNRKFMLCPISLRTQMRFMLRFRDPCVVLSRTVTESGLNYQGNQWENLYRKKMCHIGNFSKEILNLKDKIGFFSLSSTHIKVMLQDCAFYLWPWEI